MRKFNIRAKGNKTSKFIKAPTTDEAVKTWFSIMENEGYHLAEGEYFNIAIIRG